jgi:integrase
MTGSGGTATSVDEEELLIDLFLKEQKKTVKSQLTISHRRTYLKKFLKDNGTMAVTREQMQDWFDSRRKDSTKSTLWHCYNQYYKWALGVGAMDRNPVADIVIPGQRIPPPPITFGLNDIERAINAADASTGYGSGEGAMRCWIALAAFQGMQCREIAVLTAKDVNLSSQVIAFHREDKRPRSTTLHPMATQALRALPLPAGGRLFPGATAARISKAVSPHLHACGINGSAKSLVQWHGLQVEEMGKDFGRFHTRHMQLLTPPEREIVEALDKKITGVSQNYLQVISDLKDPSRIAFRGVATELRELIREVLDALAPRDQVMSASGFKLEQGMDKPTQKQQTRFILKRLGVSESARAAPEHALSMADAKFEDFTRSLHVRSSNTLHSDADRKGVRQIKLYVDAFLSEILGINRASRDT